MRTIFLRSQIKMLKYWYTLFTKHAKRHFAAQPRRANSIFKSKLGCISKINSENDKLNLIWRKITERSMFKLKTDLILYATLRAKKNGRFFKYSQETLILSGLIIIFQFIFIKANKKSLHLSKLSSLSRTKLSPLKIQGQNILPKIDHFENKSIRKIGHFKKGPFKNE